MHALLTLERIIHKKVSRFLAISLCVFLKIKFSFKLMSQKKKFFWRFFNLHGDKVINRKNIKVQVSGKIVKFLSKKAYDDFRLS